MTVQLGAHVNNARLIGEHALVRRGNGLLQLLELLIQLPIVHYLAGVSYDHQGTGSNRGYVYGLPGTVAGANYLAALSARLHLAPLGNLPRRHSRVLQYLLAPPRLTSTHR